MSFSRRNTLVLTWVMMLSAQGEAAEFSQVRPDADALMQLPVTEWLTNGGDLYNRNFSPLDQINTDNVCLLYTSPSPRDATLSRMPSSA